MKGFLKSLLFFIALLALLFFLWSSREVLGEALAKAGASLRNFAEDNQKDKKFLSLEAENQMLREELALQKQKARLGEGRYRYKLARVYSRYPFNDQSVVFLDVGSENGIKEGMPVFVEEGIFLGKVKHVNRTQSEVETIWSATWKTSVAVGPEKVKAVYAGGSAPRLELVPKEANIKEGDRVVSIAPDLPLGVLLGEVAVSDAATYDVWKTAKVEPLFSPESFSTALVLVDFP